MDETPLPITTSLKLEQLLKQLLDIVEILLGIEMLVRLVHHRYLQPIITQYFIDNKSEIWLLFLIAHSKR